MHLRLTVISKTKCSVVDHLFAKISIAIPNFVQTWSPNIHLPNGKGSHYYDLTMGSIASQITSLTIVYSAVYSGADQR